MSQQDLKKAIPLRKVGPHLISPQLPLRMKPLVFYTSYARTRPFSFLLYLPNPNFILSNAYSKRERIIICADGVLCVPNMTGFYPYPHRTRKGSPSEKSYTYHLEERFSKSFKVNHFPVNSWSTGPCTGKIMTHTYRRMNI